MLYTMKRFACVLVLVALTGCAVSAKKWASIPRCPNLSVHQVERTLGKPSSVKNEHMRVFRYGPGGWYEGIATIYRYDLGGDEGRSRYVEFYFDGDKYLSDSTNIPIKF